ncbi:hypothetical protein D3C87_1758160 [compost metagenome]
MVEVPIAAEHLLRRNIAPPLGVVFQIHIGRVRPLQRVAHKGELEALGKLLGKLQLIPIQGQMPRVPTLEQGGANAIAGTLGYMNEQA